MADVFTSTPDRIEEESEVNNNQENLDEIVKLPLDEVEWIKPDANVTE